MAYGTRELTCINCPLGCLLTARLDAGRVVAVSGNGCKRGETYAREELTNPVRMVTTTVPIEGAALRMLPVRTASPVPKGRVRDVVASLASTHVRAPVGLGDVVAHDVAGTGIDVVASRSLARA